jgi:hypothetical protein
MDGLGGGPDNGSNHGVWPHSCDETAVSVKPIQRLASRGNSHPQNVVIDSRKLELENSRSGANSLAEFRGKSACDWETQLEEQAARTCADTLHERTSRIDGTQVSPSISKKILRDVLF